MLRVCCAGKLENFVDYESLVSCALKHKFSVEVFSDDGGAPFNIGEKYLGKLTFQQSFSSRSDVAYVYHGNGKGVLAFSFGVLARQKCFLDVRTGPINVGIKATLVRSALRLIIRHFPHKVIMQDKFVLASILRKHEPETVRSIFQFAPMAYGTSITLQKKQPETQKIRLVYAGSLTGRNMQSYVRTMRQYDPSEVEFHFYTNPGEDFEEIQKILASKNIPAIQHGIIPRQELLCKLSAFDIGISYIPPGTQFAHQVPTKIFDYFTCGLPSITNYTATIVSHFGDRPGLVLCESLEELTHEKLIAIKSIQIDITRNHPTYEQVWSNVVRRIGTTASSDL